MPSRTHSSVQRTRSLPVHTTPQTMVMFQQAGKKGPRVVAGFGSSWRVWWFCPDPSVFFFFCCLCQTLFLLVVSLSQSLALLTARRVNPVCVRCFVSQTGLTTRAAPLMVSTQTRVSAGQTDLQ